MKLPVLATVADAWRELIHDWRVFVRLAAAPFAIAVVGAVLLEAGAPDRGLERFDTADVARVLAFQIVSWLVLVPAVTGWHRHVILGPGRAATSYRIEGAEFLYVRKALLFGLLVTLLIFALIIPIGLVTVLLGPGGDVTTPMVAASAGNIAIYLALAASIPWTLVLPAAALGRAMALGEARMLARGNRLRLIAIVLLAYLPEILLSEALPTLLVLFQGPPTPGLESRVAWAVLGTVAQYAFLAVTVGALSFSYLRLTASRGPAG